MKTKTFKYAFLISQPSSGSTLLQTILSQHEKIFTYKEGWIGLHMMTGLRREGINVYYNRDYYCNYVSDFFNILPDKELTYFKALRSFYDELFSTVLEGKSYEVVLDKTPRYYLIVDELKKTFPDAKFIFLIRNPLAVLSSILNLIPNRKLIIWEKENNIDLLEAPKRIYNQKIKEDKNDIFINYEELLSKPDIVLTKIQEFLGIPIISGLQKYDGELNKLKANYYGDNSGNILQNTLPNSQLANKWIFHVDNAKFNYFYKKYLNYLGAELYEGLGYSYQKFYDLIYDAKISYTSKLALYPGWKLVVDEKESSMIMKGIKLLYRKFLA